MNFKFFTLFIVTFSYFFSACTSSDYEKDVSGIEYLFFKKNNNAKSPKVGDILVLNMKYYTENDSLLFDTKEVGGPFRMQMKAPAETIGTIDNGFAMMHEGDSASFLVNAQLFFEHNKKVDVPAFVRSETKLKFFVKLEKILSFDEFEEERTHIKKGEESEELSILEGYLKRANITNPPTESGLYIVEREKGTGKKVQKGKPVTVHYLGSFIDGRIFDTTYERGVPFSFIAGVGQVIEGMDEGILQLSEGSKAQLVIPSKIAYGDKGLGEKIPPYSTLIFEIEIIAVDK